MFIQNESFAVRRRDSPLNLCLVAMIIRCFCASSSVHATADIFRPLLFISQMPLMEKSLFFSVKNCKNHHFFERNAITVAEIILKTEKHGKAEIGNSE